MELSRRLQAVADFVCDATVVADVGTDHGYIPIYLVTRGLCEKAYALDVNQGPLLRAETNICEHALQDKIETRLSDGVRNLKSDECDFVIIAGMGGALTMKIMMEGEEIFRKLKGFVLQPQSEICKVREYLYVHDYRIVAENMVMEEGKFYPMMLVEDGKDTTYNREPSQRCVELRYGRELLAARHPILKMYLEKEQQTKKIILAKLTNTEGEQITERKRELMQDLEGLKKALSFYK